MNKGKPNTDETPTSAGQAVAGEELGARARARRRLLVGGGIIAAPTIITLKSRPVLAWGSYTTPKCSAGTFLSKNPSHPHDKQCGDSHYCWKDKHKYKWDEYCNYKYSHGKHVGQCFSNMDTKCKFKKGTTWVSSYTMWECITNTGHIYCKTVKNGSTDDTICPDKFEREIITACLNGAFYGDDYCSGGDYSVKSYVNSCITTACSVPSSYTRQDWVNLKLGECADQLAVLNARSGQ